MNVSPPKVFISYSHDSAAHKKWVLEFATTLRNRGIDAILDQWDLKPGDDLPLFMEQSLTSADFAVMVCTKRYVEKANAGEGGVGYEKMIMTASSLSKISDSKVIPIVRERSEPSTPIFLNTKLYIDFSKDSDIEYSLDELLRFLLNAPLYEKPQIGSDPFRPLEESRPDPTSDGVKEVMRIIATLYDETSFEHVYLKSVMKKTEMRRLTLERYLREASKLGYLKFSNQATGGILGKPISITDDGISYLEKHQIIEA